MSNLDRKDFSLVYTDDGQIPAHELCGWAAVEYPNLFRDAFNLFGSEFPRLKIFGALPTAGGRSMLWEIGRKVLGQDTLNYAQLRGDCVSFGAKNAGEYVQFYPIVNGARDEFTTLFPPYLWGCGRIFIGENQLGTQDGSIGVWQAKAVMEYGVLANSVDGVPEYSSQSAYKWGNYPGPDKKFVDVGKKHIIKSAAQVQTWEDLMQALMNGYPVTIASNVGYTMMPQSDGYHHYTTHWAHQMCCIGVDDGDGKNIEPHACILNSWGPDVHGTIQDFRTKENWPGGTLRVRRKDIEAMLNEGDSFAYSSLVGFPAQPLPRDLFDLFS